MQQVKPESPCPCPSLNIAQAAGEHVEHVDIHNLGLIGAQKELVKAIIATGTPTIEFWWEESQSFGSSQLANATGAAKEPSSKHFDILI